MASDALKVKVDGRCGKAPTEKRQKHSATASSGSGLLDKAASVVSTVNSSLEKVPSRTDVSSPPPQPKVSIKKKLFLAKGYSVVRGLLSADQVAALGTAAKAQKPDPTLKAQYHQHGDAHRYEYLLDPPIEVAARVREVVEAVCASLEPAQAFAIVSEPGSADQPWHTDSIPGEGSGLTDAEWRRMLHYIGVLTPLTHTGEGCGRTEVKVASHNNGDAATLASAALTLAPGDALVLDGRTLHRGMANTSSDIERTICFLTYKMPRFEDGNHHAYLN